MAVLLRGGSKRVAWSSKELALDFMHTCSRPAHDMPWNSEKEKELTFKPTPSQKLETTNLQWARIIRSKEHQKTRIIQPYLIHIGFWVLALLREHVFRVWKHPLGSDYPTLKHLGVGQTVGWFCREQLFQLGFVFVGLDNPTGSSLDVG